MRQYSKNYNSLKNRKKRSDIGKHAISVRWVRDFAAREPQPHPPADLFRLAVQNLITGKETIILFHPGDRKNNFKIDIDGTHWKTCGMVAAEGLILSSLFAAARKIK